MQDVPEDASFEQQPLLPLLPGAAVGAAAGAAPAGWPSPDAAPPSAAQQRRPFLRTSGGGPTLMAQSSGLPLCRICLASFGLGSAWGWGGVCHAAPGQENAARPSRPPWRTPPGPQLVTATPHICRPLEASKTPLNPPQNTPQPQHPLSLPTPPPKTPPQNQTRPPTPQTPGPPKNEPCPRRRTTPPPSRPPAAAPARSASPTPAASSGGPTKRGT